MIFRSQALAQNIESKHCARIHFAQVIALQAITTIAMASESSKTGAEQPVATESSSSGSAAQPASTSLQPASTSAEQPVTVSLLTESSSEHTSYVHICNVLDPYAPDGSDSDDSRPSNADYLPLYYKERYVNIVKVVLKEWKDLVTRRLLKACYNYLMRGRILPKSLTEDVPIAWQLASFLGSWPKNEYMRDGLHSLTYV